MPRPSLFNWDHLARQFEDGRIMLVPNRYPDGYIHCELGTRPHRRARCVRGHMQAMDEADEIVTSPAIPTRRPTAIALTFAALGLIGLLAIGARFVGTDESLRAMPPSGEPTETPSVAAAPTPHSTATTAATESALPTATIMPPTPQPTVRETFYNAVLVGDYVVVNGSSIRERHDDVWRAISYPSGFDRLDCESVQGDLLVAVGHRSNEQFLLVLDPATRAWTVASMPARIQGAMHRAPDYCSGIQVGTNWVFAVWTLDAIQFAISADQGASFRTLNVWLPPQDVVDWWTPSTTYTSLSAGSGEFSAELCASAGNGTLCPIDVFSFDNEIILGGHDVLDWSEELATRVSPSDGYAGSFWASGALKSQEAAEARAFDVRSVGGDIWRSELDRVALIFDDGYEVPYAIGNWAAGPVGAAPVPLTRGLQPILYPYIDGVVAEVPLVPGWLPRKDRLSEWWLLADGTAQWIELAEPPLVDWDTLDPGSQASLYLAGLDEILVIPS